MTTFPITEQIETWSKKGRGKARRSLDLIEAMYAAAKAAQPITGRGIGYKLFAQGLIASMAKPEMQRVYRLLKDAREQEAFPGSGSLMKHASLSESRLGIIPLTMPAVSLVLIAATFGTSNRCASRYGARRAQYGVFLVPYSMNTQLASA
jgi:hypothetical protein